MDTEEEDTTITPKKQKIEERGQLVQIKKFEDNKKKQMKVKDLHLRSKNMQFYKTPIDPTSQFKNRSELFDKYKYDKEVASNESLKLYA